MCKFVHRDSNMKLHFIIKKKCPSYIKLVLIRRVGLSVVCRISYTYWVTGGQSATDCRLWLDSNKRGWAWNAT